MIYQLVINGLVMKKFMNRLHVALVFIIFPFFIQAQEDCFPKKEKMLVYDKVGSLNTSQINTLESKLVNFNNSSSTQITIVIVDDLCGYDKASYTIQLAEEWGVGQKAKDNGIMILVKPTGGSGQRHTFIAVGYGLEAVIPDATAKRIVEQEMIPRFKNGDIYGGLDNATTILMKLATKEFAASEYKSQSNSQSDPVGDAIYTMIIILGMIIFTLLGTFNRARRYSRRNNVAFWTAFFIMSSSSNRRTGSYRGFSSGTGGFSGGFGGGSFGGGGAGGSW